MHLMLMVFFEQLRSEIEVSDDCYQKYVMNLVRGWNMESTIYYAKCYWENKKDEIFKADE